MNVKDSALLSQATYIMGDKRKSRQDKYDEINNLVKDTGYTVIPKYTNKNLVTFENEKGGVHVAHQGTNVKSTTGFKDIVSDIGIALGLADHLPSVRKRKRQTERVVRELKPEQFTLSGHSLGGYTVNQTLSSSKKVRNALTQADTFNAGSNPILNDSLKVNNKVKNELKDKVKHHRVQGDLVSAGLKSFTPFGKIETYKLKKEDKDERGGQRILNKMLSFNPLLSNITNLGKKAIDSHHIDHFHQDRLVKVTKNDAQSEEKENESAE